MQGLQAPWGGGQQNARLPAVGSYVVGLLPRGATPLEPRSSTGLCPGMRGLHSSVRQPWDNVSDLRVCPERTADAQMAEIGRVTNQSGHLAAPTGLQERDASKGLHQLRDVCGGRHVVPKR